jgi:hypothetical protein
VKCDRKEKCSQCFLSKSLCIYSIEPTQTVLPARTRTVVPLARPNPPHYMTASYTPPQVSATGPLPGFNTFKRIRPKPPSRQASPLEAGDNGADSWTTHHASPSLNDPPELNELNRRIKSLEQLLSNSTPDSATEIPGGQEPPSISHSKELSHTPRDRRVALNKSRLYGQSHWTAGAQEVSLASNSRQPAPSADNQSSKKLRRS